MLFLRADSLRGTNVICDSGSLNATPVPFGPGIDCHPPARTKHSSGNRRWIPGACNSRESRRFWDLAFGVAELELFLGSKH